MLDRGMFNVALYKPLIPANTGNISRLCVGSGCSLTLVGELGFDLSDRQMKRAGLDHWKHLNLKKEPNLDFLANSSSFALISKFGKRSVWDHPFQAGDTLVFGSEISGLPDSVLDQYEEHVFGIPMPGPVRSLNLANTVAIVVYEGMRQLQANGLGMAMPTREKPETFFMKNLLPKNYAE